MFLQNKVKKAEGKKGTHITRNNRNNRNSSIFPVAIIWENTTKISKYPRDFVLVTQMLEASYKCDHPYTLHAWPKWKETLRYTGAAIHLCTLNWSLYECQIFRLDQMCRALLLNYSASCCFWKWLNSSNLMVNQLCRKVHYALTAV